MPRGDQHLDAPAGQPPRSDAEHNRERIVAAARTVVARGGLNASMASVAREAGVGIATMFRHFPTETEPVDAVFIDRRDAYTAAVTAALKRNYGDGGASMGSTGKGRKRRADSAHGADVSSRSCISRQIDVTSDAECMSNASLSRHPQRRGTA